MMTSDIIAIDERNRISRGLREKIRCHRSDIASPDRASAGHQDAGIVLFKTYDHGSTIIMLMS